MESIKQAFVLAAGFGNRLRPLTDNLPKPLVPIFQKPLITFAFDHLIATGVRKLLVNTHRHPECFAHTFPSQSYESVGIEFLHEPELLETGGGIKNAEPFLDPSPFIVYSGDILTDFALEPLIEEHFRAGNDVTLALRETNLASDVALRDGRVIDINNQYGHPGGLDFANVSIWNPAVFRRIPPGKKISFIPILVEWIGEQGKIGGVIVDDGEWFNIGSRTQYLEVHRTIAEKSWKPSYIKSQGWPTWVAESATVDASVRLAGVYSIGPECRVGSDVLLEDTILWTGAQIASRSHLRNCIVRSHQTAQGELCDLVI
jgi:NDP-sugar pyrophosphorylase family protein